MANKVVELRLVVMKREFEERLVVMKEKGMAVYPPLRVLLTKPAAISIIIVF